MVAPPSAPWVPRRRLPSQPGTWRGTHRPCPGFEECVTSSSLQGGGGEGLGLRLEVPPPLTPARPPPPDVDECQVPPGASPPCDHHCHNHLGGFHCSCRAGYALHQNQRSCSGEPGCPAPPPTSHSPGCSPRVRGCTLLCFSVPSLPPPPPPASPSSPPPSPPGLTPSSLAPSLVRPPDGFWDPVQLPQPPEEAPRVEEGGLGPLTPVPSTRLQDGPPVPGPSMPT